MNAWPQNKLKEIVDNEAAPLSYLIGALEDHVAKVSAELGKARAAKARADSYPVNAQAALCPKCWKGEREVALNTISSSLRCPRCREQFSLSF
jgi:hypothetical protein